MHRAGAQFGVDSVERGDDLGDQRAAGPRTEHALRAVCGVRSVVLVRDADARAEGLGETVDHLRSRRCTECASGEGRAARLVGQDSGADGGKLEAVSVVVVEQSRRRLAAQPFEQPALLQPRPLRQLFCREWPGLRERAVQAQTIAQVDHQRDHLALLVAPHVERVGLEFLGIEGGFRVAHQARSLHSWRDPSDGQTIDSSSTQGCCSAAGAEVGWSSYDRRRNPSDAQQSTRAIRTSGMCVAAETRNTSSARGADREAGGQDLASVPRLGTARDPGDDRTL